MKDIRINLGNNQYYHNLKQKISFNHKDIYSFPPIFSDRLKNSEFHISHHESQNDHVRLLDPTDLKSQKLLTYPFDRKKLISDILAKKSLGQFIDTSGNLVTIQRGIIVIVNSMHIINEYFASKNFGNILTKLKSRDYFVMRNRSPSLSNEVLLKYFPNINIDIDPHLIFNNTRFIQSKNIQSDLETVSHTVNKMNLIFYMTYENPSKISMLRNGNTYVFDFNNPENLINKMPGGKVLLDCLRPLSDRLLKDKK